MIEINKYVKGAIIAAIFFWLGTYIGSVSFEWHGFTDGWVSAVGSWVSGIIAGWALFYAINKDRGDSRKKLDIINSNIRELGAKYFDSLNYKDNLTNYISTLKSNIKKEQSIAGMVNEYHIQAISDSYTPINDIEKEVIKIKMSIRINVSNIPDSNMKIINDLVEQIIRCCDVIEDTAKESDLNKQDCDFLILTTNSLSSLIEKYGEAIFNLDSIMQTNKEIEKS